jgi:Ca-activated chloride channel homolog
MRRVAILTLIALLASLLAACGTSQSGDNGGSNAPANAVVVKMLYGSEKQAWIEAVTPAFNAQQLKTASGKPIFVEAIPAGSADSLERILNGSDRPAVWSPASSILIPVANERWGQANNGATLVEDAPPLVLSPVVIAMWRPMAEALGWPTTPLGWADIAELAASGKSWADYGHPEWGAFQFGHTHPDYSNSGITSILATTYAATSKTRGLTVADVQKPETAQFLGNVEKNIIHYGESTGFFGRQMFNRGPSYLSAAVLYENLVVESYDTTKYPNRALPVVAIYPKEGTFWSDHPYAILNAPWVDDELREAATAYRNYLLAAEQQQRALQFGFRPADPGIAIGAPITPENGVDPQQPSTLLEVPSVEVIEATRALWGQNKKRVEVEIVIDISGSMNEEERLVRAKEALRIFIDQLADEDRVGITVFSTDANVLSEISELGPKRQEVLDRVEGLFATGNTRLIDTVREVYERMQQRPAGERIRAVVVLSDGDDNRSQTSADELLQLLQVDEEGRSIKVFTIAYGSGIAQAKKLLEDIANTSGARTYTSDPARIQQIYRDIATFF